MINTSLPLVDLHRHLDGNVRVSTIWELAHHHGIALPADSLEALIPMVQIQDNASDLMAFLSKLDWMVAVLANLDDVRRVAYENVIDAAAEGLDYTELRFSPYYMAMKHQLPLEGVVEAVIDGVQQGVKQQGLKRQGIKVKLIGILSRTFGQQACSQELTALLAHKQALVGIDLAGNELDFPGQLFVEHFKKVRDAHLAVTIHAGEAAGAASIWQAIKELGATRIGHGVSAIEDPHLMEHMAKHKIGIESCPTSNLHTSTVASYSQHPMERFMAEDILVSLNTDDPGVSAIDIGHEYHQVQTQMHFTRQQLEQLQKNGLEMAWLSGSERQQLTQAKQQKA